MASVDVDSDADGNIDTSATVSLREKMKKDRGDPQLFDYGPGIEVLRANCEAETGLPAPKQPEWQHINQAEAAE